MEKYNNGTENDLINVFSEGKSQETIGNPIAASSR